MHLCMKFLFVYSNFASDSNICVVICVFFSAGLPVGRGPTFFPRGKLLGEHVI